jgi:hypothetical protein
MVDCIAMEKYVDEDEAPRTHGKGRMETMKFIATNRETPGARYLRIQLRGPMKILQQTHPRPISSPSMLV